MEELIKFVTTEQSKRSDAFMFLWKVLMAVLMANHQMNKLGYYFINQEIKFNMIIDFLLSEKFFYASFFYLLWIGIFFWGLRVLTFVEMLFLSTINVELSENYLLNMFEKFGFFKKDLDGNWYFKNREGFEAIQVLCNEMRGDGSFLRKNIYAASNVLISTCFWYNTLKIDIPFELDLVLIGVSIFAIIQVFGMEWLLFTGGRLENMMFKYKEKGFYSDLIKNTP